MTNEQLGTFLSTLAGRLEVAVEEADEQLEDAPRNKEQRLKGTDRARVGAAFLTHKDPDMWEEVETGVIALDALRDFVNELKAHSMLLKGKPPSES